MKARQQAPDLDRYAAAVEKAIADNNGDLRGAVRALLIANEYLEAELSALCVAVSSGYARKGARKGGPGKKG